MAAAFQLSIDPDGIGRLVFDLPNEKVNKFSLPILEELEAVVDNLSQRSDIKALVFLSGKEDIFIAGADLHSFEKIFKDPSQLDGLIHTGHRIFTKISKLPFPTIAYIHGACLGGGCEFALSCTYRIGTDSSKTLIGLPEVSLGIIPGWGGTQRLPRLVGLMEAMDIILPGKAVRAPKAFKIHLIDALVPHEFKEEKIDEFVNLILSKEGKAKVLNRRKQHGWQHFLLQGNPLGRALVFSKAEKEIKKKTKGHYPAPLMALKVLKETSALPLEKGLEIEANTLIKEMPLAAPVAKNLIGLFFIQEALKKETWVPEGVKPLPIKFTAVIGAGIMGSGIAWLLSNKDYFVRMKDINTDFIGKGYGAIRSLYEENVKKKRLKASEASLKFQKIGATTDWTGFQRADIVIEAATENLDLKKKIFVEAEENISDKAILATNTSSLSVTELARTLKHPERFIGIHFFNPVNKMPLVEIVKGEKTSLEIVASSVELCKKLGKTPMVVGDCKGFLVNRIFTIGANEVFRMFDEGIPHEKLDAMMLNFGFPMPPFVLADEVGVDVLYKVSLILEDAYGQRMKGPEILQKMNDHQYFGRKVGKGFYIYKGKDKTFNQEVLKWVKPKSDSEISEIEMSDRVNLLMINEASRCLQENIISKPEYLDMALIMGVGFPPFRGGILRYADQLRLGYVVDHLKSFAQKYGERFAPCDYLLAIQQSGKTFYTD